MEEISAALNMLLYCSFLLGYLLLEPREVVELLRRLAREQSCAVLMVTHDPRIVDVADRLLQMEDGRLKNAV